MHPDVTPAALSDLLENGLRRDARPRIPVADKVPLGDLPIEAVSVRVWGTLIILAAIAGQQTACNVPLEQIVATAEALVDGALRRLEAGK